MLQWSHPQLFVIFTQLVGTWYWARLDRWTLERAPEVNDLGSAGARDALASLGHS